MNRELARNIRKLCIQPWKRELLFADKTKWRKLWASIDLINDTHEAIDYYSQIPESKFSEGGYLYVYGVLQALFVQQDAARSLNQSLFGKDINFKKDHPQLYVIREHRNNSIGHPSSRGKNDSESFHVINGTSIIKSGFEFISHFPSENKSFQISNVDLDRCIETQSNLITNILEKVMDKLNQDFEQHKKNFKGEPLIEIIGNDLDYSISKLYEFESPLLPKNHKYISETYENIKEGIKKRYTNLRAIPGVQLTCERIDYILERLQKDLINSKNNDHLELEIFVDALKNHFDELIEMVKEIDREFE
jgi:hypothetical protein